MNWKKVARPREQPRSGNYSSWKPQVARDCSHRCVYCAISEARYGGLDNFHLDHFRPKARFASTKDDIYNLFLACGICNRFKSDDWPSEPAPDHSVAAYPDPSVHDYSALFDFDLDTYAVAGKYVASRYVEERLYLNRPQLIMERRQSAVEERFAAFSLFFERAIESLPPTGPRPASRLALVALMKDVLRTTSQLHILMNKLRSCPPYELAQVRRPERVPRRRRRAIPRKPRQGRGEAGDPR